MNWVPGSSRRRKLFDDLSEEMRLHLEEHVDHLIGEGLSPQQACWECNLISAAFSTLPTNMGLTVRRISF